MRMSWRALLAAILGMAGAAACDETFQPIEPSDAMFSVFGYLDASADTQWIRVMPIRALAVSGPEPLPARVTLEHLGTGRIIEMRDSLFRFTRFDPELGSEGLYLHNFWTTERIEPGASYRVAIRGEDGRSSETVVEIPRRYEVEVWIRQPQAPPGDHFYFIGLKHVALVGTNTYFTDDCGSAVERNAFTNTAVDSSLHRIPTGPLLQRRSGCGIPVQDSVQLWVAGSGAPWPTGKEYLSARLSLPDHWSEISGSVGFLGGVLTRTVPYEACQIVVLGPSRDPCRLRYDGSTAVLTGTVKDAVCGGRVDGAVLRLQEIEPGLPAPYRIRTVASGASGGFKVGALQAGLRHRLSVRKVVAGFDQFQEYVDTLEFAPGERMTLEVELTPVEPCGL